jgi:PAS domain S-box-containing protein
MNKNTASDAHNRDLERYQLLVSAIRDYAIYMLDPLGIVTSWNAGAERFKGYLPEEIIGHHFSRFYTKEDQAIGLPALALKCALEEGKFEAEGWRVRKDGTQFWANVVVDPLRNEAGELLGFAKITRDITDRKLAQQALYESEQRFRLLVQGVTDYAIYMLSPTGEITNWNVGAERIKGYMQEDVIGTYFSRFYTPEDQAKELPAKALATAARVGRYEQEGWRLRKDGSRFWAHVIIDAIHNDVGTLIGYAKITRDITEKMKVAEELQRANEALFQAQKMEALGNLTGGVAHDFNNLLSVISSGLDVLAQYKEYRKDLPLLDSMQRAVNRGSTLTQQLLSFARRQPLKMDLHNINRLIANFEPLLKQAGNSRIALDIQLDPQLQMARIDPTGFEAALLNLIVNSVDAMPDGGRILITTRNTEIPEIPEITDLEAGTYILVRVEDNGTGVPPEVVEHVFEPFFTTKEIGKGTGLGLSQVYGFIKQSGGNVILKSDQGKGTVIEIYLPAVASDIQSPADTQPGFDGFKGIRMEKGNDVVLIVEDEPEVMLTAAELFKSLGYEVMTASNGVAAIEVLESNSNIDVLFSDVVMPNGVSGIVLGRSASKVRPDLKIVLVSGYPLPALKEEHGDLDEFVFLNKPYRLADLARCLRASSVKRLKSAH